MRTLVFLVAPLVLAACHSAAVPGSNAAASADLSSASSGTVTKTSVGTDPGHVGKGTPLTPRPGHELAAFAEGCFWGSENTFRHVAGVTDTAVGYTGGITTEPTYETVCSHTTKHAETVLIEFDPKVVSYSKLVQVFFKSHDPTQMNRQGPDFGDQYRSEIFTFSPEQDAAARAVMKKVQAETSSPLATKLEPIPAFWKAEEYHQQYDEKSGRESCPLPGVINPQ